MPDHHHRHYGRYGRQGDYDHDDSDDCDDRDHKEVIGVGGKYLQYAELQSECRLQAESRV